MSKTLYRGLLPSGRGVRFRKLTTRDFLAINQRVASKVGDRKDPGGGIARTMAPIEIVATAIESITLGPLAWAYGPAAEPAAEADDSGSVLDAHVGPAGAGAPRQLDVDAMLDAADAGKGWTPVSYAEVMRREGPLSFDELFGDLADFEAMVAFATGMGREDPTRGQNLLGKVQAVSVV
jgi:hypothetical protein